MTRLVFVARLALCGAALFTFANHPLRAEADNPDGYPQASSPEAAAKPDDGIVHLSDKIEYRIGTHQVKKFIRYNWEYADGQIGSMTTYTPWSGSGISTHIDTYSLNGSRASTEGWITNTQGIIHDSSSTMCPNGSLNRDITLHDVFGYPYGGSTVGPAPFHSPFCDQVYKPSDIRSIPSAWSISAFGGADAFQGYSNNVLHITDPTGNDFNNYHDKDSLGGVGGIQFQYTTRPISFNYLDVPDWDDDCECKYWHYDDDYDTWYFDDEEPPRIWDNTIDDYRESTRADYSEHARVLGEYPPPIQLAFGGEFFYDGNVLNQSYGGFDGRTNMNSLVVLGDAKVYFDLTPKIRPYAVFGAGFSYINASTALRFAGTGSSLNLGSDDQVVPTIKGGVGLEYSIDSRVSVYGEYDHLVQFGTQFSYSAPGNVNYQLGTGDISRDIFSFGVRVQLGK